MKKTVKHLLFAGTIGLLSCNSQNEASSDIQSANSTEAEATGAGQSAVQDATSNPNIVQVAVGSKDHTTLVTAVKAAGLVDVLSNAGPFTVYAPTNSAFEKLPDGTVEGLLKPEKKEDGKINLNALARTGYVAGGPEKWIESVEQFYKSN